jgi:hypothetical protein
MDQLEIDPGGVGRPLIDVRLLTKVIIDLV